MPIQRPELTKTLKHMELKKVNPSTQKEAVKNSKPIIQKSKTYLPSVLLAVVIATAFFIHMSFPLMPDDLYQAKTNWEAAKAENTTALNALKQLNFDLHQGKITLDEFAERHPALVEVYTQVNQEKNKLYKIYEDGKSETKFLQFGTFQLFLGEIGWAVGLLLYAFFNLLYVFYLRKGHNNIKVKGKIILHSTLLFIGLFYTCYVFYSKDDFSREWYFVAMVLATIALIIASKFIVDAYLKRITVLKENMDRLIRFVFRVRTKHYKKIGAKALYAEQHNIFLNPIETAADNANEFEEDFYETLDKIEL